MQARLIIKNFGPIKDVDIHLKNVNVFIGAQASGKSVLAKLFTIVKAPRSFLKGDFTSPAPDASYNFENSLIPVLEEYNIDSFLQESTEISFMSDVHTFAYSNSRITYTPKLLSIIFKLQELIADYDKNCETIQTIFLELSHNFIYVKFRIKEELYGNDWNAQTEVDFSKITEDMAYRVIRKIIETETALSTGAALYIPAERNLANIIKSSALNLILHNVPIPKHLLSFGAELERSKEDVLHLDFIAEDLIYRNVDGKEFVYTDENIGIRLDQAASGIQSVVPILLPILAHKRTAGHRSFVIEEPELNLFPTAQYGLIKYLESRRNEHYWEDYGAIHTYTTHSPYILSALNNLLMANKVSKMQTDEEGRKLVSKITSANINPFYFTAYQIKNGTASSIFSTTTGLIEDNFIDEASDELADDFDNLMRLMK